MNLILELFSESVWEAQTMGYRSSEVGYCCRWLITFLCNQSPFSRDATRTLVNLPRKGLVLLMAYLKRRKKLFNQK